LNQKHFLSSAWPVYSRCVGTLKTEVDLRMMWICEWISNWKYCIFSSWCHY